LGDDPAAEEIGHIENMRVDGIKVFSRRPAEFGLISDSRDTRFSHWGIILRMRDTIGEIA
jgi:hypothetical protein